MLDLLNESNQDSESHEHTKMEDPAKNSDNDKKLLLLLKLIKHFDLDDAENTIDDDYMSNKLKRSFHIEIYYDIVRLKDGAVLLVPKDKNKNHYFIG